MALSALVILLCCQTRREVKACLMRAWRQEVDSSSEESNWASSGKNKSPLGLITTSSPLLAQQAEFLGPRASLHGGPCPSLFPPSYLVGGKSWWESPWACLCPSLVLCLCLLSTVEGQKRTNLVGDISGWNFSPSLHEGHWKRNNPSQTTCPGYGNITVVNGELLPGSCHNCGVQGWPHIWVKPWWDRAWQGGYSHVHSRESFISWIIITWMNVEFLIAVHISFRNSRKHND